MATYILSDTNSDLIFGEDFDLELEGATKSPGEITVQIAAQTVEISYAYTPKINPDNADWATGTITVEVNITSANVAAFLDIDASRVDLNGIVLQTTLSKAGEQQLNNTGILNFTIPSFNWNTGATEDRLRINYHFRNSSSHGNVTIKFEANTADAEIVSSFTVGGLETYRMTCIDGSIDLTGISTTFTYTPIVNFNVDPALGNYNVSGQNASLDFVGGGTNFNVDPALGTYNISGQVTALDKDSAVNPVLGTYSVTGLDADLDKDSVLRYLSVEYIITGRDAALDKDSAVNPVLGTYSYTGLDASLDFVGGGTNFNVDPALGVYTVTGLDAALDKDSAVNPAFGVYTVTGLDAALGKDSAINPALGTYTFAGQDAALDKDSAANPALGIYTFTGQNASLDFVGGGANFNADPALGTYTFSGQDASLDKDSVVNPVLGTYVYTGQDPSLTQLRVDTITAIGHVQVKRTAGLSAIGHLQIKRTDTITGIGHVSQNRIDTIEGIGHASQKRIDTISGIGHVQVKRTDTILAIGHVGTAGGRVSTIQATGHVRRKVSPYSLLYLNIVAMILKKMKENPELFRQDEPTGQTEKSKV